MLNYSMCPNGAMMICESISEYDLNVVAPPVANPEVLVQEAEHMDPIVKCKEKLGEMYKHQIAPLLNMDLNGSRSGDMLMLDLDRLNHTTSTVFDKLVMMIVKTSAMSNAFSCNDRELLKMEFNAHRGKFIRNAERVHQQGVERYSYTRTEFPGVCDWGSENAIIGIIKNLDDFSDAIITKEIIVGMQGMDAGALGRSFASFMDLNNCIYSDYDRFARLEVTSNESLDFDWMIRQETFCTCPDEPRQRLLSTSLVSTISQFIRKSKCTIYDMCNAIIDGTMTPDWYNCEVKKLVVNIYNLFTVATIYIFREAYRIRNALEYRDAVNRYTKLLLDTLKLA